MASNEVARELRELRRSVDSLVKAVEESNKIAVQIHKSRTTTLIVGPKEN